MLDQVKEFLGIEADDTSKDFKLNIYIKTAEKMIIQYLNNNLTLEDIEEKYPEAVVLMVFNAYRYYKADTNSNVKSEKQGDREVVYKDDVTVAFAIGDDIKSLLPKPYVRLYY